MSSAVLPDTLIFHGNGGTYPPYGLITPINHGPYVVVTSWVMICLAGLSTLARLGTRRALNDDNFAIFLAMTVSILQSTAMHVAVNNGLGQHLPALGAASGTAFEKATYASQILGIISLCLAKASLLLVFVKLTPTSRMKPAIWTVLAFVALWGTATVFALAFQCRLSHPWDFLSNKCINRGGLYYSSNMFNLLTDLAIIMLPVLIIRNVLVKKQDRYTITIVFSTRILVCISIIGEMVSLKHYIHSSDPTWTIVTLIIWNQVTINLSIITACIPLVKPFLTKLQFSLLDSSVAFSPSVHTSPYHYNSASKNAAKKNKGGSDVQTSPVNPFRFNSNLSAGKGRGPATLELEDMDY